MIAEDVREAVAKFIANVKVICDEESVFDEVDYVGERGDF